MRDGRTPTGLLAVIVIGSASCGAPTVGGAHPDGTGGDGGSGGAGGSGGSTGSGGGGSGGAAGDWAIDDKLEDGNGKGMLKLSNGSYDFAWSMDTSRGNGEYFVKFKVSGRDGNSYS